MKIALITSDSRSEFRSIRQALATAKTQGIKTSLGSIHRQLKDPAKYAARPIRFEYVVEQQNESAS